MVFFVIFLCPAYAGTKGPCEIAFWGIENPALTAGFFWVICSRPQQAYWEGGIIVGKKRVTLLTRSNCPWWVAASLVFIAAMLAAAVLEPRTRGGG